MLESLLTFITVFIIVYLLNHLILNTRTKKNKEVFEITYLSSRFKLDKESLLNRKNYIMISLINSFIIAFTVTIIFLFDDSYIFQMLIGFIILCILIIALYEIYGKYLVKKGLKNGNKRD